MAPSLGKNLELGGVGLAMETMGLEGISLHTTECLNQFMLVHSDKVCLPTRHKQTPDKMMPCV